MKRTTKLRSLVEPKRIIEYVITGGAYFWSGYLVFFICDSLFGLDLFWSKLLANIVGWTINYLLQRKWVFGDSKKASEEQVTIRYAVITLVNFLLDYLIVAGLNALGLTPYIGQFVSAGFFTVWSYLWYKLWVFPAKAKTRKRKHRA